MMQLPLPKVHLWTEEHDKRLKLLSGRFSPPQVDFEEAAMLDDRVQWVRKTKRHLTVNDIELSELEKFYDFCYMLPGDLIFYLYPVFSAYMADTRIDTSAFYLYSFDRLLTEILSIIDEKEKELIRHALHVMYECNWSAYASGSVEDIAQGLHVWIDSDLDIGGCSSMQEFLSIHKKIEISFP